MIGNRTGQIPDVSEPLIGFRTWESDNGKLVAPYKKTVWELTEVADCHKGHVAPEEHCDCGLYAYHDPRSISQELWHRSTIVGVVQMWGECQIHETGVRAQRAKVVAVAIRPALGRLGWVASIVATWLVLGLGISIVRHLLDSSPGKDPFLRSLYNGLTHSVFLLTLVGIFTCSYLAIAVVPGIIASHRARKHIAQIEERYGIPVVPYHALGYVARGHGRRWSVHYPRFLTRMKRRIQMAYRSARA